jgi:ABC-type transporter Mla MlaB component
MDIEQLYPGAKCTIAISEEPHAQMETLFKSRDDLELDAPKVEQLDASALQLLFSFHQTLENDGRNILWKSPSDQLVTTAKLLGVDNHLAINNH